MDKNAKQKKAAKAKAEEEALNRILCWVAGGAVLEFLLLLLSRYWSHYTVEQIDFRVALGTAVKILAVAALCCAAGAGYWWNSARKKGQRRNCTGKFRKRNSGLSKRAKSKRKNPCRKLQRNLKQSPSSLKNRLFLQL